MNFQVGDRVVAIKKYGPVDAGDTGTYVHTHRNFPRHGVRWDKKNPHKHSCSHHCEKGHGWYMPEGYLKLEDIPDLGDLPEVDFRETNFLFSM